MSVIFKLCPNAGFRRS